MARRPRRNHSPAFKAKVAVAAIKGESEGDRGPSGAAQAPEHWSSWRRISTCTRTRSSNGVTSFWKARPASSAKDDAEPKIDVKTLHAKIGELTLENDFLSVARGPRRDCCPIARQGIAPRCPGRERKKMIDRKAKLSQSRQVRVLGIGRGSIYYQPQPVTDADLKLMHRIDQLHMEFPFAPSRDIPARCPAGQWAVGC